MAKKSKQCPICKSTNSLSIAAYNNPYVYAEKLRLFSCKSCGMLFYNPFPSVNYAETLKRWDDKFYVEFEADLPFFASLLYPLKELKFRSMLDIGCGLGFLLDIANTMLDVEEITGIEPSFSKRSEVFDLNVINGYFPEAISQENGVFDLIVASEVLEHTLDPLRFLQNVTSALSNDGIAVLTTPNADAFFEEKHEKFKIANPGQHTIIFSYVHLTKILNELNVGFKIFLNGGKSGKRDIVIYLSKNKDRIEELEYIMPADFKALSFIEDYLEKRLAIIKQAEEYIITEPDKWLFSGLLSRLIEIRVNKEQYELCEELINDMVDHLSLHYNIDISNIASYIKELRELTHSKFPNFIEVYPAFLGKLLYLYATWLQNYKGDYIGAHKLFATFEELKKLEQTCHLFNTNKELDGLEIKNYYQRAKHAIKLKTEEKKDDLILNLHYAQDAVRNSFLNEQRLIKNEYPGQLLENSRQKLCIFSHFDRDNVIGDYVVYYLESLSSLDFEIVFVSTCEKLSEVEIGKIKSFCSKIIIRENIGADFGSWKIGVNKIANKSKYEQILLANDSVYGPLSNLKDVFDIMEPKNLDIWGITDSWQRAHHIQSFFLVFNKRTIDSEFFDKFWDGVKFHSVKERIIDKYEVGLSQMAYENGFNIGALYDYNDMKDFILDELYDFPYRDLLRESPVNPTHFFWNILLQYFSCPFIKIELLRDNPSGIKDIDGWMDLLSEYSNYKTDLIESHLDRMKRCA